MTSDLGHLSQLLRELGLLGLRERLASEEAHLSSVGKDLAYRASDMVVLMV